MHFRLLLLIGIPVIFLASCASEDSERETAHYGPVNVSWIFDNQRDKREVPRGDLVLAADKQRVLVASKSGVSYRVLDRSLYPHHNIPSYALTACFGWWAGAGEEFYVARQGDRLLVFGRDLDEMVPPQQFRLRLLVPLQAPKESKKSARNSHASKTPQQQ